MCIRDSPCRGEHRSPVPLAAGALRGRAVLALSLIHIEMCIRDSLFLDEAVQATSPVLERTDTLATDPMIMYFTSGTTGYPKAVIHDFTYALAHIVTAVHWQNVKEGGLHLTVADTGWGKASWGKLYGCLLYTSRCV